MHCPNCDRTINGTDAFCIHCGQDLGDWPPIDEGTEAGPIAEDRYRGASSGARAESGMSMGDSIMDRFDSLEDLSHGQVVIIAARWILVGAGLLLALWNPDAMGELQVQIMLILSLAVANFFLHSRVLMGKPVAPPIAYGASAIDIAVISLIVIAGGGFGSGLYVFYFPALLALSVAFRTEVTYTFAVAAIVLYGLIASTSMAGGDGAILITRVIMLAGVAFCGNVYWRTERDRRQAAAETRDQLLKEVRETVAAR